MPYFYTDEDIEIDVDEFLDKCSTREVNEIIEWLEDTNHLDRFKPVDMLRRTSSDNRWNNSISKLLDNRWKLSKEEEETIIKIVENNEL